jgi:hypothetical protein
MDAAPAPVGPSAEPNQPAEQLPGLAPLAVIRSYNDLLVVARARMAALNVTYAVVDEVSGVQLGYSAKLLAGRTRRRFGDVSLCAVLGSLGLRLVVCEDPEQLARVHDRLTPRRRPLRSKAALALLAENPRPRLPQRGASCEHWPSRLPARIVCEERGFGPEIVPKIDR